MSGHEAHVAAIAGANDCEIGHLALRRFPDGESYVRLLTPVAGCEVVFVTSLDDPDGKTLQLLFVAAAARDLGAQRVGLVAPYLAYMRQDTRFNSRAQPQVELDIG
ncbi:MAG: ribose-phosphate pyrophosphokinase-like domain-containing protein, partial [Betaproteobacteria bacterium]